jgi:hypothetical protein
VYYRGKTVFMTYVDDGIFAGPDRGEIETLIKEIRGRFKGVSGRAGGEAGRWKDEVVATATH